MAAPGSMVRPHLTNAPLVQVVLEQPTYIDQKKGSIVGSRSSKYLADAFGGFASLDIIPCIPYFIPPKERKGSRVSNAIKKYLPEVRKLLKPGVPTLWLGRALYNAALPLEIRKCGNFTGYDNQFYYMALEDFTLFNRRYQKPFEVLAHRILHPPKQDWSEWRGPWVWGSGTKALEDLQSMVGAPMISWDIETYGTDPFEVPITCIGFYDGTRTVVIPWDDYPGHRGLPKKSKWVWVYALKKLFSHPDTTFVCHNGNYDVAGLRSRGINARVDFDTMHAQKILYPELRGSLIQTAAMWLPDLPDNWKEQYKQQKSEGDDIADTFYLKHRREDLFSYNTNDVVVTYRLVEPLQKALEKKHNGPALFQNAMENNRIAMHAFSNKWLIDRSKLAEIKARAQGVIDECDAGIKEMVDRYWGQDGTDFNADSAPHKGKILYTYIEEPIQYRTDSGKAATNKEALEMMGAFGVNEDARTLAKLFLRRAKFKKLVDSYIPKFEVPHIRPNHHVTMQVSGRWSCTRPPLQTVPQMMKDIFHPPEGYYLMAPDYDQLELRIIAQIVPIPTLLEVFETGKDAHQYNAFDFFEEAFGITLEQAKEKQYRNPGKTFQFALNYVYNDAEIAAKVIYRRICVQFPNIEYETVLKAVRTYLKKRPQLPKWKSKAFQEAKNVGYAEAPWGGRRRYFWSDRPKETDIYNYPLQSGAAFIVDTGVQALFRRFEPGDLLYLQRHDEVVLATRDPLRMAESIKSTMEQTIEYNGVTMRYSVGIKIGNTWGNLREVSGAGEIEQLIASGELKPYEHTA